MWNFSIARALGLMIRTAPFLVFRASVHLCIAAALIVITGVGVGAGYGIGAFGDAGFRATGMVWGGIAGFVLTAGVIFFLRKRLLYLARAGQVAVMVDYLDGRPLPYGHGQIAHARAVVFERFGPAVTLDALDRLIRGVIGVVPGLADGQGVARSIPGPGQNAGVARAFQPLSVGLVDQVILAHAIRSRSENAWEAAHDGLVLYAQNARPMLVNAAWLSLIGWGLAAAAFVALLGPADTLVSLLPGEVQAARVLVALSLAWAVKSAVIDPFALACMLQVYFRVTDGQEPLPEWRGRLTQLSDKFRQLGERALGWRSPTAQDA